MTFIASVIARKGVALVADSLATFSEKVVTYERFMSHLRQKQESAKGSEVRLDKDEIGQLFKKKPSHTNDYAEKIFQFDRFTAILLAGASQIGEKPIEYLIQELAAINERDENYHNEMTAKKVRDFCEFMNKEAMVCIAAKGRLPKSILLFTHYEAATEKTIIYKIIIERPVTKSGERGPWEYVSCEKISEDRYVIIEGQSPVSKRILKEESRSSFDFIPYIIEKMSKDFNLPLGSISLDYIQQLINDVYLNRQLDNLTIQTSLSNLSLQQAVNMAYLFLKMEITFQASTEKIPTVGGRIKIAVIDRHGFRYITGHNILKPY